MTGIEVFLGEVAKSPMPDYAGANPASNHLPSQLKSPASPGKWVSGLQWPYP
jgi:hypothetical protein